MVYPGFPRPFRLGQYVIGYRAQNLKIFGFFVVGVKSFSLPLSERATLGMWKLQVEVDINEFSTEVEVSAIGADYFPDIAAAEEHYVELRFGREMRRSYKPGLPFIGKVIKTIE